MIIAKTRMRRIPDNCKDCSFYFWQRYYKKHYCGITGKDINKEFISEKRNWCNVKPKDCPLKEVNEK